VVWAAKAGLEAATSTLTGLRTRFRSWADMHCRLGRRNIHNQPYQH